MERSQRCPHSDSRSQLIAEKPNIDAHPVERGVDGRRVLFSLETRRDSEIATRKSSASVKSDRCEEVHLD